MKFSIGDTVEVYSDGYWSRGVIHSIDDTIAEIILEKNGESVSYSIYEESQRKKPNINDRVRKVKFKPKNPKNLIKMAKRNTPSEKQLDQYYADVKKLSELQRRYGSNWDSSKAEEEYHSFKKQLQKKYPKSYVNKETGDLEVVADWQEEDDGLDEKNTKPKNLIKMAKDKFINDVEEYNVSIGAKWLYDQVKKLFPGAYFMDMGYEGGYSPRLVNGEFTSYAGKKENTPKEGFRKFYNSQEFGDTAFGTTVAEYGNWIIQVFHAGNQFRYEINNLDTNEVYIEDFKNAKSAFEGVKTFIEKNKIALPPPKSKDEKTIAKKWENMTVKQRSIFLKEHGLSQASSVVDDFDDLGQAVKDAMMGKKYPNAVSGGVYSSVSKEGGHYYIVVDMDERGQYGATVYDENDNSVWDVDEEELESLIDDGFLKRKPHQDRERLARYLVGNGVIPKGSVIFSEEGFPRQKTNEPIVGKRGAGTNPIQQKEAEIAAVQKEIEALQEKETRLQDELASLKAKNVMNELDRKATLHPWQKDLTDDELEFIDNAVTRFRKEGSVNNFDDVKFAVLSAASNPALLSYEGAKTLSSIKKKFNI